MRPNWRYTIVIQSAQRGGEGVKRGADAWRVGGGAGRELPSRRRTVGRPVWQRARVVQSEDGDVRPVREVMREDPGGARAARRPHDAEVGHGGAGAQVEDEGVRPVALQRQRQRQQRTLTERPPAASPVPPRLALTGKSVSSLVRMA